MVKGLDLFRERFRPFEGTMTLIGGAACDEWFSSNGLTFRRTQDLDLVIMMNDVAPAFIAAIQTFVAEGKYKISERSDGVPILYRFTKPEREEFPAKLELSSRRPEGFKLNDEQKYIPISAGLATHSLSAILLKDDYFELIQAHHDTRDGLWVANATSLIPLKAHAWLSLTKAKQAGENVDTDNIKKHRSDVFRLAATLPGEPGPALSQSIKTDLAAFLEAFPIQSDEWPAILASVKNTFGGGIRPADIRSAIQVYFHLPSA